MNSRSLIHTALIRYKNDISFKTEEYLTGKGFIFFHTRHRPAFTKEQLIGEALDFFMWIEIRRSNLFKAAFRKITRILKTEKIC